MRSSFNSSVDTKGRDTYGATNLDRSRDLASRGPEQLFGVGLRRMSRARASSNAERLELR